MPQPSCRVKILAEIKGYYLFCIPVLPPMSMKKGSDIQSETQGCKRQRCVLSNNTETQPSPLILPHFGFAHVSFIHVPENPSLSPHNCPLPLPSGYCQFGLYFNVSGYILLACLFCWLGSTYRWNHMVFVFHHQAYFT